MDETVFTILTSMVSSGAFSVAVIWLTQSLISERLKNAIKSEYDLQLESHKAHLKSSSDTSIEKLKSNLVLMTYEHQIKFSKLHEKRADVIAEIHEKLHHVLRSSRKFVDPIRQYPNDIAESQREYEEQQLQNALFNISEFVRLFESKRIYFSKELCLKIDVFIKEATRITSNAGWVVTEKRIKDKDIDLWNKSWDEITKDVPKLLTEIEDEFRKLLFINQDKNPFETTDTK